MLNNSDTNIKTEVMDGSDLNRNNSGLIYKYFKKPSWLIDKLIYIYITYHITMIQFSFVSICIAHILNDSNKCLPYKN